MAASSFRKRIRYALGAFWLVAFVFLFANMQARGVSDGLLISDDRVRVEIGKSEMIFLPTADTSEVGLIFYPGALADPIAYVPLAREIADAGFKVVIQKLPWRLAPFASHRKRLFEQTKSTVGNSDRDRNWVIGGHSKGGALAAEFAATNASMISGLLLVGTTHPRERDLSHLTIDIIKIVGTRDGLASPTEVEAYRNKLPSSTRFIRVEGGNHAHFAWYGWQLGDRSASITRQEQHNQTVSAIVNQLKRLSVLKSRS